MNEPLQTTLADIVKFLDTAEIRFALIGGQATSVRGQQRVTADIDLVLAVDVAGALSLVRQLEDSNFEPLFTDVEEVVQRAFVLPLRHRSTRIKVDLAVGLSGFEQRTVDRAERVELGGCLTPVATAEDLIIMKLLAGRPRDEQDLQGMVVAQSEHLDWEYCQQTAVELGEAIGVDLAARVRELRRQQSDA